MRYYARRIVTGMVLFSMLYAVLLYFEPEYKIWIQNHYRYTCYSGLCLPFVRNDGNDKDIALEAIFKNRRKHLWETCQVMNGSKSSSIRSIQNRNLLYNVKHKFLYCMVEKVGCTFWRRVFYLMDHQKKLSGIINPFSIPHQFVHQKSLIPTLIKFNDTLTKNIIQKSVSVMFVREPYERAYSGYIDKLFSPNPFYWSYVGKQAIRMVRKNASRLSLRCGHDLSFKEFIQYLVTSSERGTFIDIHFTPMHSHCLPCQIHYDFIGKMETFNEDARYLIKKQRLFGNLTLVDLHGGTTLNNIKTVLNDSLESRKTLRSCLTPDDIIKRAWDTLKLRGFIAPNAPVPLVNHYNVTVDRLLQKALKFSHKDKILEYKRTQISQMFRTLDDSLIERFRKYISKDAKLFGYNDRPAFIFKFRKYSN